MIDTREFITWLAVGGDEGCTDEEFAETFVMLYKMWETQDKNIMITKDDIRNFDIEKFGIWLTSCLGEIIYGEDIDPSAWWKQEEVVI